jgi:hypothetical protein
VTMIVGHRRGGLTSMAYHGLRFDYLWIAARDAVVVFYASLDMRTRNWVMPITLSGILCVPIAFENVDFAAPRWARF